MINSVQESVSEPSSQDNRNISRFPKLLLCTVPVTAPGEQYRHMDLTKSYRQPRLGPQAVRDFLIQDGFPKENISFLDIEMLYLTDEELEGYFRECRADVVGLSAPLSHSYLQVKRIAKIIRRTCPDSWIVLGGHLSSSATVVLKKTEVDVCIVGDGETPFLAFVNFVRASGTRTQLEELAEERGICFLNSEQEVVFSGYSKKPPMESLPMPDYEFFKSGLMDQPHLIQNYFKPGLEMGFWFTLDSRSHDPHRRPNSAQVPTSKGCTARCTFCQRSTKGYRLASVVEIEKHLVEIIEKYDVGFIDVLDENFGGRRDQARAFADLMAKYDLLWTATGVRCRNVNAEDITYFKARGCCSLKFGVESGSQKILDVMEKNFTVRDVEVALEACWENDLFSPLAMMVGMPGEDQDTIRETGQWIGKMYAKFGPDPRDDDYALFYALPFPGTPLYSFCVEKALINGDLDSEESYLMKLVGRGTNKWAYRNVNGAKTSHWLVWDYQVEWWAAKTYKKIRAASNPEPQLAKFGAKLSDAQCIKQRTKQKAKRGINFQLVETALRKAYLSAWFLALPSVLAFPLMRWSYFVARGLFGFASRIRGKSDYVMSVTPPTLTTLQASDTRRLGRSLRSFVRDSKMDDLTEHSLTAVSRNKLLRGNAG